MQIRRTDKDWPAVTFLLVEEGSQAHILKEIGQIQKEKMSEEPLTELQKEHYSQPNHESLRSGLEMPPEEDTKKILSPKEKVSSHQKSDHGVENTENKEQIQSPDSAENGEDQSNLNIPDHFHAQNLDEAKIPADFTENQIESELHQDSVNEPSKIQAEPDDREKVDSHLKTPKKIDQELQQLASELRQKTRSQQKDVRRQVRHDYIYNHNSVLLGERIEDIDFDETYFTRPCRLSKKKGHQDPSSRKKRQTGAGECCICYGRSS